MEAEPTCPYIHRSSVHPKQIDGEQFIESIHLNFVCDSIAWFSLN